MERVLKIDPEFQNKIPPLTGDEFTQLEENILDAGEVYEPITVWNDTIIDGHNRYKVVLMHPGIRWRVREVNFDDKWEAFDWMYKNQLGRRNLTDEQRMFLIGKMYESRKRAHGGDRRSEEFSTNQSDKLKDGKQGWMVNQIAEEQGISPATVKRSEDYANGIEAIREREPELADSILKAEKKVPKIAVIEVAKADPDEREVLIDEIVETNTLKRRGKNASTKEIGSIVETLSDNNVMEYTISMMKEQIRLNADAFIRSLSNMLKDHDDLYVKHTKEVNNVIDEIICKIEKIKGDIE